MFLDGFTCGATLFGCVVAALACGIDVGTVLTAAVVTSLLTALLYLSPESSRS
jgi:hypothetical protein